MDYAKNQKYFEGIDMTWANRLIIAGVVAILVGFGSNFLIAVLGILAVVGGIAWRISKKKGIVTDAEYDNSVAANLNNMKSRALAKLGIDEDEVREAAPISFGGYKYIGADKLKRGEDHLYRTNKYETVMLFFSSNEVHCYTYTFASLQTTDSENGKDIVSVSTASDSVKVLETDVEYEAFKLTTAGGTSISISLRDVDNAQRSINAMRSLIKSKKVA